MQDDIDGLGVNVREIRVELNNRSAPIVMAQSVANFRPALVQVVNNLESSSWRLSPGSHFEGAKCIQQEDRLAEHYPAPLPL